MNIRTLVIVTAIILISGSAITAFHVIKSNPIAAAHEREVQREQRAAQLVSKVEVFNMTLPCKPEVNGAIAVAHADLVITVPIKHRVRIEQNGSKLRDIISTVFRSNGLAELNADSDLNTIKMQIAQAAQTQLKLDIEEILFLRFEYDVLEPR